jgi:hypothetical protein
LILDLFKKFICRIFKRKTETPTFNSVWNFTKFFESKVNLKNLKIIERLLYIEYHTDARSFLFVKNEKNKVVIKYKTKSTDLE